VQAGAEVPQDEDQHTDDEQGLQRIVHDGLGAAAARRWTGIIAAAGQGAVSARGRRLAIGWLLALVAIAAFTAAGRWQLGRMHEKEAMLADAASALDRAHPQPLLLASDPGRASAYDWAAGRGDLLDATVWLDNQQRAGRAGVRMYCVLLPDEGAQALLLDAGWWPLGGRRELPVFGCPQGRATAVRGLLAPPPSVGLAQ